MPSGVNTDMTVISHTHKFIFLANQKCGSSSLHSHFRAYKCRVYDQGLRAKPVGRHDAAYKVKQFIEKTGRRWGDYFVFTTIRNPFDRILSCFAFEKKRNMASARCDFDTYVRNKRYKHFVDIKAFTCDKQGRSLVDVVIRLENIEDAIPQVFKRIGLPPPKAIRRKNTTRSAIFKKLLTPQLKEIIRKRHANDFRYY